MRNGGTAVITIFNSAYHVQQYLPCSTVLTMFNSAYHVPQCLPCSTVLTMFSVSNWTARPWALLSGSTPFWKMYHSIRWIRFHGNAPDTYRFCRIRYTFFCTVPGTYWMLIAEETLHLERAFSSYGRFRWAFCIFFPDTYPIYTTGSIRPDMWRILLYFI